MKQAGASAEGRHGWRDMRPSASIGNLSVIMELLTFWNTTIVWLCNKCISYQQIHLFRRRIQQKHVWQLGSAQTYWEAAVLPQTPELDFKNTGREEWRKGRDNGNKWEVKESWERGKQRKWGRRKGAERRALVNLTYIPHILCVQAITLMPGW